MKRDVEFRPDGAKRLTDAAVLVRRTAGELNVNASECGTCGVRKYENFAEYQAATELNAMAGKLERLAKRFGGKR